MLPVDDAVELELDELALPSVVMALEAPLSLVGCEVTSVSAPIRVSVLSLFRSTDYFTAVVGVVKSLQA